MAARRTAMAMKQIAKVVALYVRVSTEDQAQSGLGLAAQIERCAAYARAVGLD